MVRYLVDKLGRRIALSVVGPLDIFVTRKHPPYDWAKQGF